MSRKPNSECQIMVFRPTMEEFSDFSRYIMYMESQGAHRGGVAKIIPPKEWSPRKNYDNIDNLMIPAPISQVVTGQKGLYTQYNIQQKPMNVKEMRRLTNTDRYASPFHESYEDLERTYWKNITFNPAIYGADISGSLYDKDVDVWNIARLDTILDLIENDTGVKIEGVNTAYLYFGMWKTSFAWHTEDMDLYSINYVHFGAPKTWYSVPPEHGKRLERLATGFFPNSNSTCPAFLRHKMTLISPSVLRQYGIPFNKITQEAGEFMITFPYGYHSGFNHGFNCAESTNFASERWISYGIAAEKCACRKDMVYINMDLFVKSFQPEKYECWKRNKYDVKLSYTDIPPVPDFSKKPVPWRARMAQIKSSYGSSLISADSTSEADDTPLCKSKNQPSSSSTQRKDASKKLPSFGKVPQIKLEKTHMPELTTHLQPTSSNSAKSPKSPRKQPFPISIENLTAEASSSLVFPINSNTFQIKMGAVLPPSALAELGQWDGEWSEANSMTLMDRVKIGRRNTHALDSSLPSTSKHVDTSSNHSLASTPLLPNSDHDRYTKKVKQKPTPYPPLPVRMKVLNNELLPNLAKLVSNPMKTANCDNATSPTKLKAKDGKIENTKVTSSSSSPVTSAKMSKDAQKEDPSKKMEVSQSAVTVRPPLKRRHPVSKKGPSKKSSPTVVLKNGSADSDSSDEDINGNKPNKKSRKIKSKSDNYVEVEGYPTLWLRRKSTFKAERQYNATVAKLPPYCSVCSLFHPYYQKSFSSNENPPPLFELLEKSVVTTGTKTKPLIPETIFATSVDNPAPLATCELLDEDGKSQLIQCKNCKVQVHASCYGISRPENPWTCDRCSFKAWIARCSLCCMRGGALKPANDGQQWAHILCAVSIPEVSFDDIQQRTGVNIRKLSKPRQKLKCTYCKRNRSQDWHTVGTCIQCCAGACATSFHPTCAHAAGVKMEPGDWPLPVFVYCHRHALQKEKAMESKTGKHLADVSTGQKVYGKHKNGRYYPCVIRSYTSQTYHHVVFTSDKSWCDNLEEQYITSHDFSISPPKPGDSVTVKWNDGKYHEAEYVSSRKEQNLEVEFEDRSIHQIKREDAYTDLDEMPSKIRKKVSNATVMSCADFLKTPEKDSSEQSYVSRRAAFNANRKKILEFAAQELQEKELVKVMQQSDPSNSPIAVSGEQ